MAKRNSTKTATKEALQASQPVVQVFSQWNGIALDNKPVDWVPEEIVHRNPKGLPGEPQQSDLQMQHNVIQNNIELAENMTLETRQEITKYLAAPVIDGVKYPFSDCFKMIGGDVYAASGSKLFFWSDDAKVWRKVSMIDGDTGAENTVPVAEIERLGTTVIVMTGAIQRNDGHWDGGEMFIGDLGGSEVKSAKFIDNPMYTVDAGVLTGETVITYTATSPSVDAGATLVFTGIGIKLNPTLTMEYPYRLGFQIVYANQFGTTIGSAKCIFYTDVDAIYFGYDRYVRISQTFSAPQNAQDVTEVDIYLIKDDALLSTYYGSANPSGNAWSFMFRGSMFDVTGFTTHQPIVPTQNTTKGPNARYMTIYDGRAFYWNGVDVWNDDTQSFDVYSNRIWIGGNAERPLSIAMGAGGRFLDVEPGLGSWCTNVLKFKTFNGATIITALFGHENAYGRSRYNILEINIAMSNEISQQDYMYEQVANVIGCNSRRGSAVFEDGLYIVDRYGLAVTTQAMESSNQLRVQYASHLINAVFNEMPGYSVDKASIICVDSKVYICLNNIDPDYFGYGYLDNVILVYDIAQKGWYTFTLFEYEHDADGNIIYDYNEDGTRKTRSKPIHPIRLVAIDWDKDVEGVGIITDDHIYRLPTTYPPDQTRPEFNVLLQSGEVGVRTPLQQFFYLRQMEFRFDYIIGDATITVDGTDVYGRRFTVRKEITTKNAAGEYEMKRYWPEWLIVEKNILSYNIRLEGQCRFRLTSIKNMTYAEQKKIGVVWGFDSQLHYVDAGGREGLDRHYLRSYNNLRDAVFS